jgi:hypothetical protein
MTLSLNDIGQTERAHRRAPSRILEMLPYNASTPAALYAPSATLK